MGGEGKPELSREWLRRMMELERKARPVMEWVMCSTCLGYVLRKKRSAMPNPDDASEVEEMLADAKKMRAAVMPEHPLVDGVVMEPDAATKNLWMRRGMMLDRCPTCYRPLSDTPETKPRKEDKMVAADETMKKRSKRSKEDGKSKNKRSKKKRSKNKKKISKNKNKRSMEEPRGGENWKMVASEGEAMVADLGSREDSEYPMVQTGKSSSDSNEYSTTGLTGKSSSEYSMGRTAKRRTKMVTCRLSKEFVQAFIQTDSPFAHITNNHIRSLLARQIAEYEVQCEVHAYWQSQCEIKGYVEYQEEVTDDEDA